MRFYVKFINLPGKYSVISSHNKATALREVGRYRTDAVVFSHNDACINFDQYENRFFERINYVDFPELTWANGKDMFGNDLQLAVCKPDVRRSLSEYFKECPGGKDGQIFESEGWRFFNVKITPKLKDHLFNLYVINSGETVDSIGNNARKVFMRNFEGRTHFPLFTFKIEDKIKIKKTEKPLQIEDKNYEQN